MQAVLSIIRLFFWFSFLKADEQEANVVILEDDSLKQEFQKQVHETL